MLRNVVLSNLTENRDFGHFSISLNIFYYIMRVCKLKCISRVCVTVLACINQKTKKLKTFLCHAFTILAVFRAF